MESYSFGSNNPEMQILCGLSGASSGLKLIHVHESEQDALEVGRSFSAFHGIPFFSLLYSNLTHHSFRKNIGLASSVVKKDSAVNLNDKFQRYICFIMDDGKGVSFDPNRIFSEKGIKDTCIIAPSICDSLNTDCYDVVSAFSARLIEAFDIKQSDWIVALHNNVGGHYGMKSYQEGGKNCAVAEKVNFVLGDWSCYNFILTNDSHVYEKTLQDGFNAVLQLKSEGDGSIMDFAIDNGLRYINIETLRTDFVLKKHLDLSETQYGQSAQRALLDSVYGGLCLFS